MANWSKLRCFVWASAWMVLVLAKTVWGAPLERSFQSAVLPGQTAGWQGKPGLGPDGPVDSPSVSGKKKSGDASGEEEHEASGSQSAPPEEAPDSASDETTERELKEEENGEPVEFRGSPGEEGRNKSGKEAHQTPTPGPPGQGGGNGDRTAPTVHPGVSGGVQRGIPRSHAAKPKRRIVLLLDDGAGARTINLGDAEPGAVVEFKVSGRVISNVYWRLAYTASDFSSTTGKSFPISHLAYGGTDLDGLTPLTPAGDIYPLRPPTGEAGYAFEHVFVLTFPEDAEPGPYSTEIRYAALPVDQPPLGKDGGKANKGEKNDKETGESKGKGGNSG